MPPGRRLSLVRGLRSRDVDLSVDREQIKPYSGEIARKDGKKAESFPDDYMDLDEFVKNATQNNTNESKSDDSPFASEDKDYPKPNVDLLASLLTLGKMIQNQKQLIRHQARQRETPSSTIDVLTKSSQAIDTPIASLYENEKLPDTNTDNNIVNSVDIPEKLPSEKSVKVANTDLKRSCSFKQSSVSDFDSTNLLSLSPIELRSSESSNDNLNSKRSVIPDSIKDIDYWDRRKRNNLAAKKSREERRKKELEVVETAKQLEKENSHLTAMLKRLIARNELLESRLQDVRQQHRDSSDVSMPSSSADDM